MDQKQEIREAIAALDVALEHLGKAQEIFDSAEGWGIWDMLGGGFLSTFLKHSRLEDAQSELNQASQAVRRFREELADVSGVSGLSIETGDFLSAADFLFDGLLADWLMQDRIHEAQARTGDAIRQLQSARKELQRALVSASD